MRETSGARNEPRAAHESEPPGTMTSRTSTRRALGLAFFAAASLLGAGHTLSTQAGRPPLQSQAEAIVGSSARDWTLMAWSLDRKRPLFAINADSIRTPASNNKVFTSIWALDMLGPEYRFTTDLLLPGPVPRDGVVHGDVYLRGSGDPGFGYPEFNRDPTTPVRVMAAELKRRGVRVIEGGIVGDGSVFDTLMYGPEWPQDTGNGAAYYAPTVGGLPYQRNMLWVGVEPGPGGLVVTREPDVPEIPVVNTARLGGGRGFAVRKPGEDTIRVKGGVSGRGPHRYPVGAADPNLLAPGALRQALRAEGIEVRGAVRRGKTPANAKLVHRHYSITLGQMLPKLDRDSDNFFAEHFWKAACARAIGEGSYTRGGAASAAFFAQRARVPNGQLWQADGSGLSAKNRTSALAMVNALAYAHGRPWTRVLEEAMAMAGGKEGTLRHRMRGTPAEGNLHAKTGYIKGVRSLSGYVKTAGGETVVFAMIYNGRNTSGAKGMQDQMGALLASYAGAP